MLRILSLVTEIQNLQWTPYSQYRHHASQESQKNTTTNTTTPLQVCLMTHIGVVAVLHNLLRVSIISTHAYTSSRHDPNFSDVEFVGNVVGQAATSIEFVVAVLTSHMVSADKRIRSATCCAFTVAPELAIVLQVHHI